MPQLLPETIRLLRETQKPLDEVARGARVKRRWLYMLAKEEIPDPGVVKVQRVYDYLTTPGDGAIAP